MVKAMRLKSSAAGAEPGPRARHGRAVIGVRNGAVADLRVTPEPLEHFAATPDERADRGVRHHRVRDVAQVRVRVLGRILRALCGAEVAGGDPEEPARGGGRAAPVIRLLDDDHPLA
jgi:hypothetical protein